MNVVDRSMLPRHWELVTMGDIATVVGGSTPKSKQPEYWGGDIPWLGVADLTGYNAKHISLGARSITQAGYDSCSTQMVPAGTVLFSSRAPVGYVAIAESPLCTSQGFKSFVVAPSVNRDYVYWYLRFAKPLAESMASGTTFKELSGKAARALPIPLPPRREQDYIVAKIEELVSQVDEADRSLAAALAAVPAFRASAVQLAIWDSPPTRAGAGRIADNLARERRTAWERRREAGETRGRYKEPAPPRTVLAVPSGWALVSFDEACEFVTDGDHNPPKRHPEGVPHLTAKNVSRGTLDLTDVTFIATTDYERVRRRYEPKADDVIVTCVGTIGRVGVVPENCLFSPDRNLAGLRPLPSVLPRYLAAVLDTPRLQVLMRDASGATAQPHLYLGDLRALPIPLPPLDVQEQILSHLDATMHKANEGETSLVAARASASQLKSALMRDAFCGVLVPPVSQDEDVRTLLRRAQNELSDARAQPRANRKKRRAVTNAE